MDSGTASKEAKRLLCKAISGLVQHRWLTRHGRVRQIPEKIFSRRKIDTGTALLVQVQTRSLPALRQQFSGLMESLDINTSENPPNPKFTDALEIANQIGPTFNLLENSIASLAPAIRSEELDFSCKIDHEYGILKRYKCIDLFQKFDHFIFETSSDLFLNYLVYVRGCDSTPDRLTSPNDDTSLIRLRGLLFEHTVQACHTIDDMIQSSKRSDFSILQEAWQQNVDRLSSCLNHLTRSIDYSVRLREGDSTEDDAPRNTPQRNNLGGDNESEFGTDSVTSSQEKILINLDLLPRIRRTIPLLKLGRIFFSKLLNTPLSKTPFTLSASVSSYDMVCLRLQTGNFCACIENIVETTYRSQSEDDLDHQMEDISYWNKELLRLFDSSLMLLAFFLAPDPSRVDHPLPGDLIRSLFLELRYQLNV